MKVIPSLIIVLTPPIEEVSLSNKFSPTLWHLKQSHTKKAMAGDIKLIGNMRLIELNAIVLRINSMNNTKKNKTSRMFFFHLTTPIADKKRILNKCMKYINDSKNKIDDILLCSNESDDTQSIYAINTAEAC